MSVWCTRLCLDADGFPEDGPGPIIYRKSHVIPSADDPRGGSIDTAHIPGFLTRDGYDDTGDGEDLPCWPYLRLAVRPAQRPADREWNLLHGHANSLDATDPELAAAIRKAADAEETIILDLTQVDALIADLTEWRTNVNEEPS
jgi:hypothetical protein